MPRPRFDIVVFDLGGVLVQTAQSWAQAHELAGLPPHAIANDPAFERGRSQLAHAYQIGVIGTPEYFDGAAAASRGAYTPAEVARLHHAWSRSEYQGVAEVLDAIDASGAATGALSNTNPAHWARLDGTSEYPNVARLRHRHASHLLRVAKPDAGAYERFCTETGFEPTRVLFFDDGPANVEAARRAGWTAYLVDPHAPTAPQLLHLLRHEGVIQRRVAPRDS
ncbi:MAG: HAD-IA family hydrolase [Dehalococcoidia bacterium]